MVYLIAPSDVEGVLALSNLEAACVGLALDIVDAQLDVTTYTSW